MSVMAFQLASNWIDFCFVCLTNKKGSIQFRIISSLWGESTGDRSRAGDAENTSASSCFKYNLGCLLGYPIVLYGSKRSK